MKLLRISAHSAPSVPQPRAIAIGNFDGMHLGHQAVIAHMQTAAKSLGLRATVLSFYPHPRQFFGTAEAPPFLLQTHADKWRQLQAMGVEEICILRFGAATAGLSPHYFMQHMLHEVLGARYVITGENFAFGKGRAGNVMQLQQWAGAQCQVAAASPVMHLGQVCSSSTVRACVAAGDMRTAAALLGRPYTTRGMVITGEQLGRTFGFPTANMRLPPQLLLPAFGVYAVWAWVGGVRHAAVASYGVRPTIAKGLQPLLEVHLLQGTHALYGARLRVEWVEKLRDEETFATLDLLKARMYHDCQRAHDVLESAP
jgi:riboflavin kinase / FMN adenylyltransferase